MVPEVGSPPRDLDELLDWFERVCHGLVLLEEYPRESVREAVRAVRAGIEAHLDAEGSVQRPAPLPLVDHPLLYGIVRSDHLWFRTSLEQLDWFLRIVDTEDHGGHRQALGQYGRLLVESFRRHRDLEDALGLPAEQI